MIHEYKGLSPVLQSRTLAANCKGVPFDLWNFDADFSGCDFLEEVVQRRATIAPNAAPFLNLPPVILDAWADYCKRGTSPLINPDIPIAWMKFGAYRLTFNFKCSKLTVRKGNKYGWLVDAHEAYEDGWNWDGLARGCQEILGLDRLPLPESTGKMAGALLPKQLAHLGLLMHRVPWGATLLAWRAYKGSRMEALSVGSFHGVALDISSAFPYAASLCPMIYPCEWVESAEFHSAAFYGFAEIDVDIPRSLRASPLAVRIKPADESELIFPAGKVRCHVSMPELRLLYEMNIPFRIRQGFWGYPNTDQYPFREIMQQLWELRKYDPAAAKALSVACVGQLGSVVPVGQTQCEARGGWNPIYAAHILADVRCRIYRKALDIGLEKVKAFTVDGLIVNQGLSDRCYDYGRNKFGGWRRESKGKFLIANDYFKDRPGHHLIRDAIKASPEGLSGRFVMRERFYIDLHFALTNGCPEKAGQYIEKEVELPLGPIYREAQGEATRGDFLTREIQTCL